MFMTNSEWMISLAMLGGVFLGFGVLFAVLKERSVKLISGFNMLSPEEQAEYDIKTIVRDYVRMFLSWALVMFIGAILSWFFGWIPAVIALAVWVALLIPEMHLSVEKAFGKYKL